MAKARVLIVDYGLGNLFNVQRAFESIGADAVISASPDDVARAERVVVPGVGAFGEGMKGLRERGLVEPIRAFAASGKPVFGICLGMQLLMSESEELGHETGLDLVPGKVLLLKDRDAAGIRVKIPHIGWNRLQPREGGAAWGRTVLDGLGPEAFMYFLHSYAVAPRDPACVLGEAAYGANRFCAVLQRGNVMGCQPHPERSGEVGQRVFKNFLAVPARA